MTPAAIAHSLLAFLTQKEDFETKQVLSTLYTQRMPLQTPVLAPVIEPLKSIAPFKKAEVLESKTPAASATVHENVKPQSLSIFTKLSQKVKKACPELRIKENFEIKKASIPDCDVLVLTQKMVPEVYQALIKAIDKQLALTEIVMMDNSLIPELTTRCFKLILAPPFLAASAQFMQHVRTTPKMKQSFLGPSPLIFLDDPEQLSSNVSSKQALWQTLKTLLA